MKGVSKLLLVSALLFSPVMWADTAKPDDSDALKGVEKGKVIFDINMNSAEKLPLYLMVIQETVDDLKRQGVEPDVVLAFRGLSVKLISKDRETMELTDYEHLDKIATQIADFQKQKGVRMEACSVATRLFEVDNGKLLEGIKPVGNHLCVTHRVSGARVCKYPNLLICNYRTKVRPTGR